MRIGSKLTLGFFIISLLIAVVGASSVYFSRQALKHNIGNNALLSVQDILEEIDMDISHRVDQVRAYAYDLSDDELLISSNEKFEKMGNRTEYIDKMNRKWSSEGDPINPFVEEIINNPLSKKIRNEFELKQYYKETYGYELFKEVVVTNRYGVAVAMSSNTAQYYQGNKKMVDKCAR